MKKPYPFWLIGIWINPIRTKVVGKSRYQVPWTENGKTKMVWIEQETTQIGTWDRFVEWLKK